MFGLLSARGKIIVKQVCCLLNIIDQMLNWTLILRNHDNRSGYHSMHLNMLVISHVWSYTSMVLGRLMANMSQRTCVVVKQIQSNPIHSWYFRVTSHKGYGISNHWQFDYLCNSLLKLTTENPRSALLSICEGNLPVTGRFPTQRASNVESESML